VTRPGWITTVGTLGAILGVLGIVGAIQMPFMQKYLAFQTQILMGNGSHGPMSPQEEAMRRLLITLIRSTTGDAPAWFRPWVILAAILSLMVFGTYLYASIRLLRMTPRTLPWFIGASGAVVALKIAQAVVVSMAVPLLQFVTIPTILFGVMIYVVLLSVVLAKRKEMTGALPPPLPGATQSR